MESLGLLEQIGSAVLANGAVGLLTAYLLYVNAQLRTDAKERREAHRIEIAAKDALIAQIQRERLDDNRKGYDIAIDVARSLDANSSLMEAALQVTTRRANRRASR